MWKKTFDWSAERGDVISCSWSISQNNTLAGAIRKAAKDGREMSEEMKDLSPKLYGLARKYIDVKAAQHGVIPPDPIINVNESWSGNPDDLFIESDE